ncbi:MAG: WG repeat-containing protein [Bacteroidota bacterium]
MRHDSIRSASVRALLLLLLPLAAVGCDVVGIGDDTPDAPIDTSERLYPAVQGGDRVLIDKTGRVVVDLDGYNGTREGAEGLTPARFWDNGQNWDYYDAQGEVAFSIRADDAYAPSEGLIRVKLDNKWTFVDTEGRFLINPYLNGARDFSEGFSRVRTPDWGYGLMDRTGAIVVEGEFDDLGDMRAGRALFEDDESYGYIDATGARVIEAVYDEAREFSGGRAAVRQGQRWFYIDTSDNRPLGSTTFISAGDYAEGLAPVRTENKWEYIDESGARRVEPLFDEARPFREGRAAVQIGDFWTFIRPDGTQIRDAEFDEVEDFSGGLAAVIAGEQLGYIDTEGAYVWFPRD